MAVRRDAEYDPVAVPEEAERLAGLGYRFGEIARLLQVRRPTLARWAAEHPELLEAIVAGHETAADVVEHRMYKLVTGQLDPKVAEAGEAPAKGPRRVRTGTASTDFHCLLSWLANRRPAEWAEHPVPRPEAAPNQRAELTREDVDQLAELLGRRS